MYKSKKDSLNYFINFDSESESVLKYQSTIDN